MPKSGKPLRGTAWTLFVTGLVVTAAMVGGGLLALDGARPAGPGTTATWPGGETITLFRPEGTGTPNPYDGTGATCEVTRERGGLVTISPELGEPVDPASVPGTPTALTCDREVRVLSGTAAALARTARGPLVVVPLFAVFLGLALFVPRVTGLLASVSSPWARRPPPPDPFPGPGKR